MKFFELKEESKGNRNKDDSMGLNDLPGGDTSQDNNDDYWNGYGDYGGDMDAFGKGNKGSKGYGKGYRMPFFGTCKGCGIYGHSQRNCPKEGRGFKGTCKGCGLLGHPIAECPKGKGKGKVGYKGISQKGKGKGGGRGRESRNNSQDRSKSRGRPAQAPYDTARTICPHL